MSAELIASAYWPEMTWPVRFLANPDCPWCCGVGHEFVDCGNELSGYDLRHPCRCIRVAGETRSLMA